MTLTQSLECQAPKDFANNWMVCPLLRFELWGCHNDKKFFETYKMCTTVVVINIAKTVR